MFTELYTRVRKETNTTTSIIETIIVHYKVKDSFFKAKKQTSVLNRKKKKLLYNKTYVKTFHPWLKPEKH